MIRLDQGLSDLIKIIRLDQPNLTKSDQFETSLARSLKGLTRQAGPQDPR